MEETKTLEILLTDHISDEDGDIFKLLGNWKGSVVGALYSYTPGIGESAIEFEEEAVYPVTITADDGKGGTASESFNVTVMSTNRPPNWITIPNKTVQEGSTLTVLLTTYASDPDGDVLTFDILEGPGEINGNNYEYSPPMRKPR